jgi:hypothetical protein
VSVISGTIKLVVGITDALAAGATRLNAFNVPVQPEHSLTYSDGTTANKANRVYQASGTTTISTPFDIDLATVVCADGSVGFTRVREIVIYNDSTTDGQILKFGNDGVGTNLFLAGLLGTTPQYQIEAGAPMRFSKPIGTTGMLVDGTHKNVRIDPGAAAIPYRIFVLGN